MELLIILPTVQHPLELILRSVSPTRSIHLFKPLMYYFSVTQVEQCVVEEEAMLMTVSRSGISPCRP
jgi:hypothetical protein